MNPNTNAFIKMIKHPVKFRMFLFSKLPSAYFSGVRVKSINENKCEVIVPYKWFSTNPFRSTYFACLAMAAEMSTGTLGLMHVYKRSPAVSMLVIKLEANYFKKATGLTTFICNDGLAISDTIEAAIATGEGQTIIAKSAGINNAGEIVAEFFITWSFKAKKK
jgi:hypothetical protein